MPGNRRGGSTSIRSKCRRSERTWQGNSSAEWDRITQPGGLGVSLQQGQGKPGALKVVTTNLKGGYLRKNGVPYSDDTTMTEYFDRLSAYGTDWLIVFTIVEDPHYLNQPFITSTHFKREPDRFEVDAGALRGCVEQQLSRPLRSCRTRNRGSLPIPKLASDGVVSVDNLSAVLACFQMLSDHLLGPGAHLVGSVTA